jgi:hypothetical protein
MNKREPRLWSNHRRRRVIGSPFNNPRKLQMSKPKSGKPKQNFAHQRDVQEKIQPAIGAADGPITAAAVGPAIGDGSTNALSGGFQAIATAYADYTKKSFADTKSFVEKLSGARSLDKMIEIQTEFAKAAYETFVAESQKIGALYGDLAKQSYKPLSGLVAKTTPANR